MTLRASKKMPLTPCSKPSRHNGRETGRGAAGKVVVFGILKRRDKVYTLVVENVQTETLLPVIKRKIKPDSVVYTDCLGSYAVLDVS